MSIYSEPRTAMAREHSTLKRGPSDEILESKRHHLDAQRDVVCRAIEQKLTSVNTAVDELRFRVYYGLAGALLIVVCGNVP
ncbi:hypothetical protein H8A95_21245 [Bradyrhizobium sp. Pear76]|uniref:hypothetical protein n=1 Tax=Bradyrhizobium oropedii TaxID=1571201 RepID=UPI001E65BDA5|nr:hypothetical protein [Bradyrhizobium oropedii]MCC8964774.1 hypothetical protein [Bradyrhizobium oropedii]